MNWLQLSGEIGRDGNSITALFSSKIGSTGQQCVCGNHKFVHASIYKEFSRRFADKVSSMVVGNGLDEKTQIGPLVNLDAVNKLYEHMTDAVNKGAAILCGGKPLTEEEFKDGFYFSPTVLVDVNDEMKITYEETFGPVAPIIRFSTEEEVIQKANHTEYGLASYFYTNNLSRAHRVSEQLEYGMVGVNDPAPFAVHAPFGRVKESGQRRREVWGRRLS